MSREEQLQKLQRVRELKQLLESKQQERPAYDPATDETSTENLRYLSEDDSALRKFGHGLALSALSTGLGVKDLVTDLSETDEAVLKQMRLDMENAGWWGKGGQFTGELAQLAAPAAKVAKLSKIKSLPKVMQNHAKKIQALATMGAEGALGGAYGGAQALEEGKTRGQQATEGAVSGVLGSATGQLAGKLLRGIRQTPAAQYLADLGVKLTPGQSAEHGLPRALEYLMRMSPFSSKSVIRQEQAAEESFSKAMMQQAAPPGKKITEGGYEGIKQLKDAFKQSYGEAWEKAGKLSDDAQIEIINIMEQMDQDIPQASAPVIRRITEKFNSYLNEPSAKALDSLDDRIKKEIVSADVYMRDYMQRMKDALRGGINEEARDMLAGIDKQYGPYSVVREAAGSREGMISGTDDLRAGFFGGDPFITAAAKQKATGEGMGALQDAVLPAAQTLARHDPKALPTVRQATARNIEIPIISAPFFQALSNLTMGRGLGQKKIQALADELRKGGITAGTLGIASDIEEPEVMREAREALR